MTIIKKNLVLLGMMAVGKTTLGKMVAKNLGLRFVDTDQHIVKKNSMSIKEIFEIKGENFFRIEEKKEILKLIKKDGYVIALGGGAFMEKTVRDNILKNCISIWLDVDINILNKRSKWNKERPLLKSQNNLKKLNQIYSERKSIYKLANYKIICDKLSKKDIINKIISLYEK